MTQQTELRVFISSTFRDLQEEREHLIKKIFPEIRSLCRERGITFTEVDLRWGLTDEDVVLGQVVRTCLEEIDRCRPYFIGITGERYGYVPDVVEIYKDADLLKRYPWIEDAAIEASSIIDLEFRHAALNERNGDPSTGAQEAKRRGGEESNARFFFRRQRKGHESSESAEDLARLEKLKERVRDAGLPVEEFRDPVSLGEMVHDELLAILERDFAGAVAPSPLEEERGRHRAFAESRRHAYIPNQEYLKQLNDWAAGDEPPLVIYAESGSGKSALFSFWCEQHRRRNPEAFIVEHYVGIGAGDSDHLAIIRHVMSEIKERGNRTEEIPVKPEELERDFANWLGFLKDTPMILVIDGINQLSGRGLSLGWLPKHIPKNIRLAISSTVEGTLVDLRSRGWGELGMQPLKEREREAVVVRFLSEYHKALSQEQIARIAEDAKCAHPLFLRTLLEELRLLGEHERIEHHLQRLLKTTGTEDLFQRVLERMEDDYSQKTVRVVMSLLWASRSGLSEAELAELTGISRLKLSTLLLGLDYHLVRRDGLLTFFHDYLRRAVEKRYLTDAGKKVQAHERLAGYFERAAVSLRATRELVYALESLGERARLEGVLTEIARFEELWRAEREEVLRLWSSTEATAVAVAYNAGLERWQQQERPGAERRAAVLSALAALLERVGAWHEAEQLQRERAEVLRGLEDRVGESAALSSLAWLARALGRMEEAEGRAREAEGFARELGDRSSIALAVGYRGLVHSSRGEHAEALACYREQEEIARELGNRQSIARAVGSRGNVHSSRGEYTEAIACYTESEQIARELGDRQSIAYAVGLRGWVHYNRGEYAEALACYAEQEEIARELGDRRNIALAVGNRGLLHMNRGENTEALACYAEQEQIARELGDRQSIANAVGYRGGVHQSRGEYAEALACCVESEKIARELGDRQNIANAVGLRGSVHYNRGEYAEALACLHEADTESRAINFQPARTEWLEGASRVLLERAEAESEMPEYLPTYLPNITVGTWHAMCLRAAREHAEECLAISRELSKPDTLFISQVLLARIEAAEGRGDVALQRLYTMLQEATDDEQRAELHYWLWKLLLLPPLLQGRVGEGSTADAVQPAETPSQSPPEAGGEAGEEHRLEALRLYQHLLAKTPKHDYRKRIEELNR
jgi:tetratricopeptide (TPR) repeat protein